MSIEIPAVKLAPELVFDMLDIIDRFRDDPKEMREKIIRYYRSKSLRERIPSPKNIVRAVTFPSLRHLDLIEGYWPGVSLNPNGKTVLNAYRMQGISEAKRKLGVILHRVDETKGFVVETILELSDTNNIIELSLLTLSLERKLEVKTEKEIRVLADRLNRWLHYLEYTGFIKQEEGMIKVNKTLIESYTKGGRVEMSVQQFTDLLIRKYKELVREERSAYVPIPKLRDVVCEEAGMLKDEFYDTLRSIKFATSRYSIMLSEPMLRQKGGITMGNKYYYYISIYERR